jgi:hypothetical protein
VDLSVLVGERAGDADKFVEAVPAFVDQIDDVDHFNLFLTGIACVRHFPVLMSA